MSDEQNAILDALLPILADEVKTQIVNGQDYCRLRSRSARAQTKPPGRRKRRGLRYDEAHKRTTKASVKLQEGGRLI